MPGHRTSVDSSLTKDRPDENHLLEAKSDRVGEERRCCRGDLLAQLKELREGQVLVAGQLDEDAVGVLQQQAPLTAEILSKVCQDSMGFELDFHKRIRQQIMATIDRDPAQIGAAQVNTIKTAIQQDLKSFLQREQEDFDEFCRSLSMSKGTTLPHR